MSLEDVTKLVSAGKYEKALGILNQLPTDIFILNPHTYNLLQAHLLVKQGQFEQALIITSKIMTKAKEDEDNLSYINASLIYGDAAISLYRPLEGIQLLQESEDLIVHKLSQRSLSNQKLRSQIYLSLGSCYWIKGEYGLATEYHDKSIALGEHYSFTDIIGEGYFRKGIHLQSKKDKQSLDFLEKSSEIFKKLGSDYFLSDIYHYIALYHRSVHNYENALKYFLRSSKIRNDLGNQLDLAWSYHRIGTTYKDLGNFNHALTYLQRALDIRENLHNQESIAQSYEEIGDIYFYQGELELALTNLYWAYSHYTKIESKMLVGSVKNKIGRVFGARGDLDTAIIYFNDALDLFVEVDDKLGIPWSNLFIGTANLQKNNISGAKEFLEKALQTFNLLDDKLGLAFAYLALAKVFYYLEDKKVQQYLDKSLSLFRETHNIEGTTESLVSIALFYEKETDEKKSQEIYKEAEKKFLKYSKEHFGLIERLYRLIMFTFENQVENVDQLIKLFKKMAKKHKRNSRIQQRLQLIESFELLKTKKPKEIEKAQNLLKQISIDTIIDFETNILGRINYSTALFFEIQTSEDDPNFEKIEKSIQDTLDFIDRRYLNSWLAQVKMHEAKLEFLKSDITNGRNLIQESLELSSKHQLLQLSAQIKNLIDKITPIIEMGEKPTKHEIFRIFSSFNDVIIGVGQINRSN
jgi:tetratricopeptide (TPR) repeat protein